jgi:hypothetical protein
MDLRKAELNYGLEGTATKQRPPGGNLILIDEKGQPTAAWADAPGADIPHADALVLRTTALFD